MKNKSQSGQLITTILNEQYKYGLNEKPNFESINLLTKKTHCRSRSDSSMVNLSGIQIGNSFLNQLMFDT